MISYNAILTERKQKLSGLSSGKIDKYEYLNKKKNLINVLLKGVVK